MTGQRKGRARVSEMDVLIGIQLRSCRKARGMSITAFAEALGVTYQQAHKYETGTNRIAAGVLHRAAAVLRCKPADFFVSLPPLVPTNDPVEELLRLGVEMSPQQLAALCGFVRQLAACKEAPDV